MTTRFILILLISLFIIPSALGATTPSAISKKCLVAKVDDALVGETIVGLVSMDGHFTADTSKEYPYALFCPVMWSIGYGSPSFKYAPYLPPEYNGSGHVSSNENQFQEGTIKLGFGEGACNIKDSCSEQEACIFKTTEQGGHIADCTVPNKPMENSFNKYLCCSLIEVCDDNVDNDGNGLADCADPACYSSTNQTPKECTGNNQTTQNCIENPEVCAGNYCSYGKSDKSGTQGTQTKGFCCPKGSYSKQNEQGNWYCENSPTCGIEEQDQCTHEFKTDIYRWIDSKYQENETKWCNSQVPELQSPEIYPEQSAACCTVQKYGEENYRIDKDNIKIYGVSPACGDGDITGEEECDGENINASCKNIITCEKGYIATGEPQCSDTCSIQQGTCACEPKFITGQTY